ncbi:hypothetical protein TNIN_133661 [Trichonephila inaurata madagascariensis]|uniref:Uncharacterized protein n=2 Tax=Trichonephila inaurata madagascariensis TaxID=2747483 RepID=A0A8X6I8S6_9ARAC|nr:hypothetical protein TNIN_133661 [Trichonephila inaurata madagascariensis]
MAMIKDNPTDMDYTHATLPNSGNSTPERTIGPSTCAQLEATKADIRRYTLIAQGFENMLTTLRHSNAQDEDDPTYVEMLRQRTYYENLLDKAVSDFGSLPYCDTPGCPVHETPTSSPVKSQPTKRKDEDGFISPPPGKVSKPNLTYKEKFKINLENRFKTLKPQDTNAAGTSINYIPRNTTLQPKANNPSVKNLPPPIFLKITEHHRKQMKTLNDIFPDLRCPKFPKPRKGTQVNNNSYTNTVNSIVRPGFSYSQAAGTSNPKINHQMAPLRKEIPAALVTNQANQPSPSSPSLLIIQTVEQ